MTSIWKFPLRIEEEQIVTMPKKAEILTVQVQGGIPCMWVRVHLDDNGQPVKTEQRQISMRGTGSKDTPLAKQYIGTVQFHGYVWHYFSTGTET